MWGVLFSAWLSIAQSALQEVHIGTSYGYKTKCVTTRGPVKCPRHVGPLVASHLPDTFVIYQQNGQVCARRTDYDGDWSIHLKVLCEESSSIQGTKEVRIGSSLDAHVKCVESPAPDVVCDSNAKQVGRTGKHPDTFHIYHEQSRICARRTDAEAGWGLDLVLECQATGSSPPSSAGGATKVTIGSSLDSHVKCVDAPARNVHCDSTAKQLGRSGKYPDTFHIYHEGNRICARRTDAKAGWGLDLVLECRGEDGFQDSYVEHHDYHSDYHYGGHSSGSLYIPNEHSSGPNGHSFHGGHYHDAGSFGSFGDSFAGATKVTIGSSLDSHVKCVDAPARNVQCDSTAKQLGRSGKYPDTFHIYHEGNRICARRTDAKAGWGLDLVLECKSSSGSYGSGSFGGGSFHSGNFGSGSYASGSFGGGYHHSFSGEQKHSASYNQRKKQVTIGSSHNYIKCVDDPGHVHCDNTAKQVGRNGEFPDTFHIYHQGTQICAKRTDAQAAWGIDLVLECDLYYQKHYGSSEEHYQSTAVQIGTGSSSLKCVADPGHVVCDDTAEQLGRTGEFPDTFHVYHENARICAQRTDADSGWGINLVLDCRPGHWESGGNKADSPYYLTEKVRFCCAQHMFSTACPYDCESGDLADDSWTGSKSTWCCRNRHMGCHGTGAGSSASGSSVAMDPGGSYDCDVADPGSTGSAHKDYDVIAPARYDCYNGSPEMWSQDKAQYCRLWLQVPQGFHVTDCDSNPIDWSDRKKKWCKAIQDQEQFAPHKCSQGDPDTWSQQKFEFCCVIKGIGCRFEEPLKMVSIPSKLTSDRNSWEDDASEDTLDEAPDYPHPKEGFDFGEYTLHFDCVAEDPADLHEWSPTRQRWCCQKWGLGCKAIGDFNCSAGLWNWQRGWSGQKKNYCCKHEKKGCDGTAHDCSQETQDLSEDGQKWCCEHHMYSNGCPFNCQHGLKEWKLGFSAAKKEWCCHYEKLACEDHGSHVGVLRGQSGGDGTKQWLHFGGDGKKPGFSACSNIADRPTGLVDWCCHQMGLCHLSVSFDCRVGTHDWKAWSKDKQQHCCGSEVDCTEHEEHDHVRVTHVVHHQDQDHEVHHDVQHLEDNELDDPKAWFNKDNVMNLHMGQSPTKGHKCVTPSVPVSCPMDAGNVRHDDYPDRFRVYRRGGQVCAERTDYDKLWGLDLVLKCIKLDDQNFKKVHVGSSGSSKKCVTPNSAVTCDDAASQAGRTDPNPDTFHVYHEGHQICVQRTDADSHWGVDLVLYCRQGSWSSPYWRASRIRTLEEDSTDGYAEYRGSTWLTRSPWLLIITSAAAAVLFTVAMLTGKAYRQQHRNWTLLQGTEDRDNRYKCSPWLARHSGDDAVEAREAEMVLA